MDIEIPIAIHTKPHHAAQRGTTLKKEPQSQAGFKKQEGRQPESLAQHASVSYPFHCWIKSLNTFLRLTELVCLGLLRILLSSPLWLGHLGHLFYTFEGPEQFLEELREEHGRLDIVRLRATGTQNFLILLQGRKLASPTIAASPAQTQLQLLPTLRGHV
ncbi:hypothetical protein N7534_006687 [Penicillium rubens]|nr:hypothetical protein N7534_006687 [Penicillium rubens]